MSSRLILSHLISGHLLFSYLYVYLFPFSASVTILHLIFYFNPTSLHFLYVKVLLCCTSVGVVCCLFPHLIFPYLYYHYILLCHLPVLHSFLLSTLPKKSAEWRTKYRLCSSLLHELIPIVSCLPWLKECSLDQYHSYDGNSLLFSLFFILHSW